MRKRVFSHRPYIDCRLFPAAGGANFDGGSPTRRWVATAPTVTEDGRDLFEDLGGPSGTPPAPAIGCARVGGGY